MYASTKEAAYQCAIVPNIYTSSKQHARAVKIAKFKNYPRNILQDEKPLLW